jgi:hypothetical protein
MKSSIKKLFAFLVAYKYLLPADIYERHKFISKFIKADKNILDVGGSMSRLGDFTNNCKITTADITKPADILYDGKRVPVEDKSYDIVTSIDVMEHIPSIARPDFVKELNRIAKEIIIISAPLGTDFHLEYEKKTLKYYQDKKIKLPFLEEHVKIGLPTPEEVKKFKEKYNGKTYFSGDVRVTEKLFRIHTYENKNKYLNQIIFLLKLLFNLFMNIAMYRFFVNRKQTEYTNRFYLVIKKS